MLALVKPQFELGRGAGRQGRGRAGSPATAARRWSRSAAAALALGAAVLGYHSSGLPGPKGNRETFIWLADPGAAGGSRDPQALEALASEVEP